MKVFIISVVTLIFTAMFMLTIRFWGLGQTHLPFENQFLVQKPGIFFKPTTLQSLNELRQKYPQAGFYLDTTLKENKFYIFDLPIQEVLKPLDKVKKIIAFNQDKQEIHTLITNELKFLDAKNIKDEFLFLSDYALITENVKKNYPMWTYGSSRAEILKLNAFLSLWIEPASPVKSDIYVSSFTIHKRDVVSEGAVAELKRRNKQIIIGPVENQEQALRLKSWDVDGYILDSEEALSWL